MVLTKAQLLRAIPDLYKPALDNFIAYWGQWAIHFEINSPLRACHILAQLLHESGNLRHTEENLNYSAEGLLKTFPKYFTAEQAKEYARKPQKIASRVYANRMGNGNEASGDGWKYRGRGLIQLTGFTNVSDYNKSGWCVGNPVENPDLLSKYPECLKSAFWFWSDKGLNAYADRDDIETITKKINGGLNGYANRQFLLRRLKKEWGIK